ncbi:dihydrolipoyllysine-residue acetyltransferase [Orrella sp. 11846]|uniref:dihydrolipoyllysine-residue acetyltransferase n=1 Tax=Orrella sp. 11846 TaxID=3409913 RepID=UPI003B59E37A
MSELIDIKVPDIGDFKDVEVIEILVNVGDTIEVEQSLITVESDKASMEIPSSAAGVVKSLSIKLGDRLNEGSVMLQIEAGAQAPAAQPEEAKPEPAPAAAAPAVASAAPEVVTPPADLGVIQTAPAGSLPSPTRAYALPTSVTNLPHASPSVRKFARELGVDLALVQGSADKGRITREDVQGFVKQALSQGVSAAASASGDSGAALGLLPWPKVDFSQFGEVEAKPLSRIKKISGANLHRNWVMIPHVTNNDEADITDLEALRQSLNQEYKRQEVRVTMLAFLMKAAVAALKKFPEFNASLDGDQLIMKQYYHIGFAADTPNGLVVPVIRDVDQKGIIEIAQETSELAAKARDGKLSPSQMQGGCFTISSLGGIGGTDFTPIINAPELAILGVSRSKMMPVWDGQAFKPRLILPLSLSFDHRVIDGAAAARFNAYLGSLLADFRRIVL